MSGMQLLDVNILLYAFRADAPDHTQYRDWYATLLNSPSAFGYCDVVATGFLRIASHPRIYSPPSTLDKAFAFVNQMRTAPNAVLVEPSTRHWGIFEGLCQQVMVKSKDITDVYLAALAIESGCEFITADKGFSRFPNLRWRHPLS